MKKKVLIAMSGGVDSSVAAALMTQKGYECIGCTMKLQSQDNEILVNEQRSAACGSETDSTACGSEASSGASVQDAHVVQDTYGSSDAGAEQDACAVQGQNAASGSAADSIACGMESSSHTCCSLDDVEDARAVARKLHMPYYVFNFAGDFDEKVIDRFVRIYKEGGTPNPCIDCNRYMKFGVLFLRSKVLGCDAVVTGHYARIQFDEESGRWQLLRSNNPGKDQTYVLYAMTQEQLAHTILPLGEFQDKEAVREVAQQYGFVNSHKPDSQDLCFVPDGKYADYIERRCGEAAPHGDFVDEDGNVLGEHRGLIRYTIGQRKGLGLALPAPLYVSKIDTIKNQVVLTPQDRLFTSRLIAEDFNWIWTRDWGKWTLSADDTAVKDMDPSAEGKDIDARDTAAAGGKDTDARGIAAAGGKDTDASGIAAAGGKDTDACGFAAAGGKNTETPPVGYTCTVTAKPRYRAKEAAAVLRVLDGGKVEIVFHEPQRALTIGQAVVVYDGENVVGGGTITEFPRS